MSSEIAVSSKLLVAVEMLARIRFFVAVRPQMSLEVAPLVEDLVADVAFVWGTLVVDHLVNGQRARLTEALAALAALERLLVRVDEAMVAQVVLPPEGLVADVTLIGSLVGVRPLVDQ